MNVNLPKKQAIAIAAIVIIGVLLAVLILRTDKAAPAGEAHEHQPAREHADARQHGAKGGDHHSEEPGRGPHGGRLLADGDAELEILLAEEGGAAHFHVYLYSDDRPLPLKAAKVSARLARPDGARQDIAFVPEKDYLKSTAAIAEPHVFDAAVTVQFGQATLSFDFAEQEGKAAILDRSWPTR